MPNTLAHIGVNGFITKSIFRNSDLIWIYIGCVIPDFPWIIQRIAHILSPGINGYDLRLYVVVQASLFFCIILSAAISFISVNFWRTFLILIMGSVLHLLLDPLQIKLGNGVHLFAPIDWDLFNYGLFWPESIPTYLLTLTGLFFFMLNIKDIYSEEIQFNLNIKRTAIAGSLLLLYFILPVFFQQSAENTDSHFVKTLRNIESRTGKYIEMDRRDTYLDKEKGSYFISSFDNSYIELKNVKNLSSKQISIAGYFISNNKINVNRVHEHWIFFRDGSSYLGLLLILLYILKILYGKLIQRNI